MADSQGQIIDLPIKANFREGLNVLQTGRPPRDGRGIPNTSDFFDFSIYIDADTGDLRKWYIDRFFALRDSAFRNPKSYFHRYAGFTDREAFETATRLWETINLVNLRENLLPTRPRALGRQDRARHRRRRHRHRLRHCQALRRGRCDRGSQ